MTKHEFFHSTLRDVNLRIDAFNDVEESKVKMCEYQSWLTGLYVKNSIMSAFNQKCKYPENPLEVRSKSVKEIAKNNQMSEEEINQQVLYMTFRVREANARLESIKG